ncbi:uncharacterized protein LOC118270063 [Spodoptera frugiperda]|uniref:Uncharacterized protein LOC118270063 n=1 Tax=Spodoptera frugiperda TaxID=7108 RepID=A0A9R0ECL7_SPOFR|nr:uncharacterized protein LOC118270063 [Spodoptera frugiperda]
MSEQLVANELLAFLQQKLDVMDEVSAVQICATNFSEPDVAASKQLLFRLLNKSDQMVSRRRDGTKKSIQDIITLLKETDPDDVPTFVAKDLNKLPPVTFDHVDVTSLLKDIVFLKASLADVQRKLDASQVAVADLRSELNELRKSATVTGSPATGASNINMRRGACLEVSGASFASAVLSPSPRSPPNAEPAQCAPRAPRCPAPVPVGPPRTAARPLDQLLDSAASTKHQGVRRDYASVASSSVGATKKPILVKGTDQADDDGFVTVQRKKRRQRTSKNRCGTAPAESNIKIRAAKPNTPVYISRLHYTTKAEDIVEYVRQKLKYAPRVQLLESRHNANFKGGSRHVSFARSDHRIRIVDAYHDRILWTGNDTRIMIRDLDTLL